MSSYVAVLRQDATSEFLVQFPDVPGCFTRGATRDQAWRFAGETLAMHLERLAADGKALPVGRRLEAVRAEPEHRGATLMLVAPAVLAL